MSLMELGHSIPLRFQSPVRSAYFEQERGSFPLPHALLPQPGRAIDGEDASTSGEPSGVTEGGSVVSELTVHWNGTRQGVR